MHSGTPLLFAPVSLGGAGGDAKAISCTRCSPKCVRARTGAAQRSVLHHSSAFTGVGPVLARSGVWGRAVTAPLAAKCAVRWRAAADAMFIGGMTQTLEILAATSVVIPGFKRLKLSPILGFLLSGVVLGPHGFKLFADVNEIKELADIGVLFLLFEMGLELSLDRLRKLRRYAFGYGTLQMGVTSLILGGAAYFMGATVPEAAVVGPALSLSSSAFILQILAENGERQSRAGLATFGILLLQDIAVVPLLVLVPLLGSLTWLSPNDLKTAITAGLHQAVSIFGTLNFVIIAGGAFLKQFFSLVAKSKSSEAFTATVLLTVLGTALLTEELGLSLTMGSFMAGILLAESSFRSRIKIELEPFRGLLLGLFFITTGMSLDVSLFVTQPALIVALITSLILTKSAVVAAIGLPLGLSLAESARVGLLVSQGGEFAFVLFALANKLGFLPDDINAILTTVVVTSMALTPMLYQAGAWLAPRIDRMVRSSGGKGSKEAAIQEVSELEEFVLILGYGPVGQVVGRMLSRKFIRWVAVEIDIKIVDSAAENDLPVIYGDSLRPTEFLEANGLPDPMAIVITHMTEPVLTESLAAVREAFPSREVFVRAKDLNQQRKLLAKGATAMYPETFETSLQLGETVLASLGTSDTDVTVIRDEIRKDSGIEEVFSSIEKVYEQVMDEELKNKENDDTSLHPLIQRMNKASENSQHLALGVSAKEDTRTAESKATAAPTMEKNVTTGQNGLPSETSSKS